MPLQSFVTRESGAFIAGFAAGEVWLLDVRRKKRVKLCEAGRKMEMQVSGVTVLSCLGRLVLVGEKRGTKCPLQMFDVGEVLEGGAVEATALEIEASTKLKGIGAVVPLSENKVLVACGRGIGKAHVWMLGLAGNGKVSQVFLGTVASRSNTITTMRFAQDGKTLLVATHDKELQSWRLDEHVDFEALVLHTDSSELNLTPFDLRTAQSTRIEWTVEAVSSCLSGSETNAKDFLKEFDCLSVMEPTTSDWLSSKTGAKAEIDWEDWNRLFPPRLLDPSAYDGEMDENGFPHGFGSKALETNVNILYEGDWKHGTRHGHGQLIDERNGNVVYCGGWKRDKRHGFGTEQKSSGEFYQGWWEGDKRHGLGRLILSSHESGAADGDIEKRIEYTGFFKDGERHGLGWWTWPKLSELIPFAVSLGAIEHLGSITCVYQYKRGSFFNEFNFHRTDGVAIKESEKDLFNFEPRPNMFSISPAGHCNVPECWCCMELEVPHRKLENEQENQFLICVNPVCGMRVHLACLGKLPRRHFLISIAKQLFCEDISTEEVLRLKSVQFPKNLWACPRSKCQDFAMKSKVVAELLGRDNTTSGSIDFDDAVSEDGAQDSDVIEKAVSGTPNIRRQKRLREKRSSQRRKEKSLSGRNAEVGAVHDREALGGNKKSVKEILEIKQLLQKPAKLADLETGKEGGLLVYFGMQNIEFVIETDSDLEEALEEAKLCQQSTLSIYRK